MKQLKEKKVFSDDQLAVMRELRRIGFNFMARDKEGNCLFTYKNKPIKHEGEWNADGLCYIIPGGIFQQITADDVECLCFADYINVEDAQ